MKDISEKDNAVKESSAFSQFAVTPLLKLKNRFVLAPLYYEWEFGSRAFIKFFESRAKGGIAMAVVPICIGPHELDKLSGEAKENFINKSRSFIELMHSYDCKVLPQVFSGVGEDVNSLSTEQLNSLPEAFVGASRLLAEAGYDGIDIHGAHHSLFMSLISPAINQRQDQFGGTEENRFQLPLSTVNAIHAAVKDFPIFYRFSAVDFINQGFDLDHAVRFSQALSQAGVSCIDVSAGGTHLSPLYSDAPGEEAGEGCFAIYSQAIKQAASVPVMVAGRINLLNTAENIIDNHQADLLALGRVLVRNPDWIHEVQETNAACV